MLPFCFQGDSNLKKSFYTHSPEFFNLYFLTGLFQPLLMIARI
jgi:hypothetical protein